MGRSVGVARGLAAVIVFTAGTEAARSQEAAQPVRHATAGVEEVVVTAQKRRQNIQTVPIAITAFSARTLQERAVSNVAQIANVTPNVTLDAGTPFSGSTAVLAAFIRGIGSDDFAFNIDPGVGVYLDGVYLARSVGANQDLLDVDRVEVLKGPQGTLFGRNTIGGAISIVTHTPGDQFHVTADETVGSYNLHKERGSIDVPLGHGFAANFTFGITDQDGYEKRIPFPDPLAANSTPFHDFAASAYSNSPLEGGVSDRTVRGKLKYDEGGAFRATVTADYQSSSDTGLPNTLLAAYPNAPGVFAGTANLPGTAFDPTGLTGFNFAGLYNFCIGATGDQIAARNAQALCGVRGTQYRPNLQLPPLASVNVGGNPATSLLPFDNRFVTGNPDTTYATANNFSQLQNYGISATEELKLTPDISLRSITAYRRLLWKSGQDADGSPLNIVQLSFNQKQFQVSQELQLVGSAFNNRLNFILGGYYFNEGGSLHDYVTFDEGLLQIDGPNQFNTENHAVFGQADYKLSDLISLTLGGRYTIENKQFIGGQQDLNGVDYKLFGCSDANGNITPNGPFPLAPVTCQQGIGYPNPANPVQVYAPGVNSLHFNNFSPKIGVQFHPYERVMLYASYSRGYKSGGYTTRLTNPEPVAQSFNPEEATTYEVGAKSQFLDQRLQVNAAVFSTDYKNIQLNFQQGASPTIRNAGNARINGGELQAVTSILPGFTVDSSIGVLQAHYTSVLPGVLAVSGANQYEAGTFVGADLPKTPHFKANISPRFEYGMQSGAALLFIADYTYQSSSWNDAQRTYLLKRASSNILDAGITYTEPKSRWSLAVGGTNITNDRVITTGNSNISAGAIYGTYDRPNEWYLRLGVKL